MINLIAAVGERGEIGYKGRVPWMEDPSLGGIVTVDLAWFARLTEGGVLIIGEATYREMKSRNFVAGSRTVRRWNGRIPARKTLDSVELEFPRRDIWVCGGAKTYAAFMPYVQRFYISRIPWSGQADRFMPPIVSNGAGANSPDHGDLDNPDGGQTLETRKYAIQA